MLVSNDAATVSPHLSPEAMRASAQHRLRQAEWRKNAAYAAMNAQQKTSDARRKRMSENPADKASREKATTFALMALACKRKGGTWDSTTGCAYQGVPMMNGLGDEKGNAGVVLGALLGGLVGYALTRKGAGAVVGAMLAPPVMYAVPVYTRPAFGFWF